MTEHKLKHSMAITIHDPWGEGGGIFADQVHEAGRRSHSSLLGADGKPLPYANRPIGFDLRPKAVKETNNGKP
jgi:hypothetical protein